MNVKHLFQYLKSKFFDQKEKERIQCFFSSFFYKCVWFFVRNVLFTWKKEDWILSFRENRSEKWAQSHQHWQQKVQSTYGTSSRTLVQKQMARQRESYNPSSKESFGGDDHVPQLLERRFWCFGHKKNSRYQWLWVAEVLQNLYQWW